MKMLKFNWNRWPVALAAFLFAGLPALAHEKWFVDEHVTYFPKPEVFTEPTPFGAIVMVLACAVFAGFWWYERKGPASRHPSFLKPWIERVHVHARIVLSTVIGVMLMGAGLQGYFFAPNLVLPDTAYGHALSIAQITLGSLFIFISPLLAELGIGLGLLYLAGFFAIPVSGMAEELMFLGIAVFFMTSETEKPVLKARNTQEVERQGYHFMRIMVGLNFLILSGVKWFRPDLAMEIVDANQLNFMAWSGLTTAQFVFCAAVVETFVALAILCKVAMRPAVIAAFSVFMVTIYVLGFRELLGHLPIKSTLLILFLLGDWKKGESRIVR